MIRLEEKVWDRMMGNIVGVGEWMATDSSCSVLTCAVCSVKGGTRKTKWLCAKQNTDTEIVESIKMLLFE